MNQQLFRISNDNDAWRLVEQWVDGQPDVILEFNNWPRQRITIKGDDYHSSLRSGQMEALLAFQASMGRAYAAIAHGAYDMRRLKKGEDEQLQFTTKVEEGSSITDTDLTPLVNAVAQTVQTHPMASLIAAVVVALAIVSRPIILRHYEHKAKQLEAEERAKLIDLTSKITNEDRRRWELFDSAIEKLAIRFPAIGMMVPDVSSAYWRLASSSVGAESVKVSDIELSANDLDILAERRSIRDRETLEADDVFTVEGVSKIGESYRIQLKSGTFHLSAIYAKPQLVDSKVVELLTCLTTAGKIRALVLIKKIDKAQVSGRLMSFTVAEEAVEDTPAA